MEQLHPCPGGEALEERDYAGKPTNQKHHFREKKENRVMSDVVMS